MSRKASTSRTTARTAAPMVLFFRGLSPTPYSRESWAGGASGGGAAWALALRSLKGWKPSKASLNCPTWALGPKPLRGCWAVWPGWPAAWAGPGFLALGSGVKAIRSGPLSWGTPVWGRAAAGCSWAAGWAGSVGVVCAAAWLGSVGWLWAVCWAFGSGFGGPWTGWPLTVGGAASVLGCCGPAGCGPLGSAAPTGLALGWGAPGCWGACPAGAWLAGSGSVERVGWLAGRSGLVGWGGCWPAGCGPLGAADPTDAPLGWGCWTGAGFCCWGAACFDGSGFGVWGGVGFWAGPGLGCWGAWGGWGGAACGLG